MANSSAAHNRQMTVSRSSSHIWERDVIGGGAGRGGGVGAGVGTGAGVGIGGGWMGMSEIAGGIEGAVMSSRVAVSFAPLPQAIKRNNRMNKGNNFLIATPL